MSVKFEKDTIKQTGGIGGIQGVSTMRGGKHELADEIGTALTGGKGNVGQPGYLAVCDRFLLMGNFSIADDNTGILEAATNKSPSD